MATIATDNSSTAITPGINTSEFKAVVIAVLTPLVLPFAQRYLHVDGSPIVEIIATSSAAVAASAYAAARTFLKHKAIQAGVAIDSASVA